MNNILSKSDEEILAIAKQLREGYKMKRVLRYKTKRDQTYHSESDAEHVFALIYLAHYFLRVEEIGPSLNAETVYSILMFHDFGEIKYGDIHTYEKTQADEDREREAAKEVFASLPQELQQVGYAYWQEYEDQKTPEARFCFALDKIEPLFELFDPINERTLHVLKTTYEMHLTSKARATKEFPVMHRFNEVVSKDMEDRGVFWKE